MGSFARFTGKWTVSLAIICALGTRAAEAGHMLGSTFAGTVYDVNLSTGAAVNAKATGLSFIAGIAFSADGTLYGLTSVQGSPSPNALFTIDLVTGTSTLIGSTSLGDIREGDIAFDPTSGILYGIQALTSTGSGGLFTIDLTTGAATLVGNVSGSDSSDLSAMAFDSSGRLYIIDSAGSLLRVDPNTAEILSSVGLSVALGTTAGLAFDPETGIAYVADGGIGGTDSLYTLNVSTGLLTLVGSTGLDSGLSGLTFVPQGAIIPEPASLIPAATALLLIGITLKLRHRRSAAVRQGNA